jgi:hypothetical protein
MNIMNIPDKIKIGPYEVKVEIIGNIAIDREHGGEYCPRELKISLDSALKKRHGEIFMHEVIEAINDIYNLSIDRDDMMVLGMALYQLFIDNVVILHQGGLIRSTMPVNIG